MIRLGVLIALLLPATAVAGMRDDAAAAGRESATAISNYMIAWAHAHPDCGAGAAMGDRLAQDMVGAVDHLTSQINSANLDTRSLFILTERLDGVAPYAAQGQLSLADGYNRARCYARARAAYQVVLDNFAEDSFSAYREQALAALKHLPAG
jgi:hypothetical protein